MHVNHKYFMIMVLFVLGLMFQTCGCAMDYSNFRDPEKYHIIKVEMATIPDSSDDSLRIILIPLTKEKATSPIILAYVGPGVEEAIGTINLANIANSEKLANFIIQGLAGVPSYWACKFTFDSLNNRKTIYSPSDYEEYIKFAPILINSNEFVPGAENILEIFMKIPDTRRKDFFLKAITIVNNHREQGRDFESAQYDLERVSEKYRTL